MSKLPQAVPCPDKPPLHLRGGYLCVASPRDLSEACFSVPAVRALRHFRPHSTMVILCPESLQALWEKVPELDQVITYGNGDSANQIARTIAQCGTTFESAVIWEAGTAAKAIARAAILQRLGYPSAGLGKWLTDEVNVVMTPGPVEHRVRHYLNFVNELGGDAFVRSSFERPSLPEPPETFKIVIAPSSEYGSSYQWPVDRFKQVVHAMNERHPGIDWVIMGGMSGRNKQDARAELEDSVGGRVKNLSAETDQAKLLDILSSSSALLACDGELAHLAAHLGLPAAVIFGPNEPEWRRPLGKQSLVLREHVACSPCYLSVCPLDQRCQHEVSVETVVECLENALKLR